MIQPLLDWNRLHPAVVHFSIALLLVAPFFVVAGGILLPLKGRAFLLSALVMMAIGMASLFVALETGDAAGQLRDQTGEIRQVLQQHVRLAETTCVLFLALTAAFAHLVVLPRILKRELSRTLSASLLAAFLILYGTGALFLLNSTSRLAYP